MTQFLSFFTDFLYNLCFVMEDLWKVSNQCRLSEKHRHSREICCLINFSALGFGVEKLFINLSKLNTYSLTYETGTTSTMVTASYMVKKFQNFEMHCIKSHIFKHKFHFFLPLNNQFGENNIFHGCFLGSACIFICLYVFLYIHNR